MNRRQFLSSSIATAGLGTVLSAKKAEAQGAGSSPAREFYELKIYQLRRGPRTELFDKFYREAAIPAYNRAGIGRVGVFSVSVGPESPAMYVVLTHKNPESVTSLADKLAGDEEYHKAGAEFINAPAADPAYVRVESSLLAAFHGFPNVQAPDISGQKKPALYELRTYESHSKKANRKKIEMFEHGEIDIFRRNGVQPVFFGEALIGSRLPNLTYMVAFENQAARDKAWAAFGADPDWKKLRETPGYADAEIVCNISNIFLRPAAYSQI